MSRQKLSEELDEIEFQRGCDHLRTAPPEPDRWWFRPLLWIVVAFMGIVTIAGVLLMLAGLLSMLIQGIA